MTPITEVPRNEGPAVGVSLIVLKLNTPEMLNQSASFNGVVGSTYDTLLTVYRSLSLILVAALAKISVLTIGIVP